MRFKNTLLTLFFLIAIGANGQDGFIEGMLFDGKTQEPIPFATIRIKGYSLGVISNRDGGFKIPEKFQDFGDVLEISCLGYLKKEVDMKNLYRTMVNRIRLVPSIFELDEAIVIAEKRKPLSAKKIVKKAIERIIRNHPINSFSTVGYYRDYQLKDNKYINLNEAILNVFDRGFDELDWETSKVKLYAYRQNATFGRDTLGAQPYDYASNQKIIDNNSYLNNYGGNEFTILKIHDAIRNHKINSYSFVNRLHYNFVPNHDFFIGKNVVLDDEVLYRIHFKKTMHPYNASGTIYISKRDFAIHKMEYTVLRKVKEKDPLKPKHTIEKERLHYRVITEYRRKEGKMYLNYISFNNRFQVRKPPEFRVREVVVLPDQKAFKLSFTGDVAEKRAFQKGNYRFLYKGKKLKFERVVVMGDQVKLFLKLRNQREEQTFWEIYKFYQNGDYESSDLIVNVMDIEDTYGRKINHSEIEEYDQFREFFVQRVSWITDVPESDMFMNKSIPIFKGQPVERPDDFGDYWMNTPLQKVTGGLVLER